MHIQETSLKKFTDSDAVTTEEMIDFLEHLDQCDFCLEQMIEEEIHDNLLYFRNVADFFRYHQTG